MKRLACTLLIVTLLASGLLFVGNSHATTIEGQVTSNTEWTVAESPIIFNGTVTVNSGVTLTIDPGVTVDLGVNPLVIDGTLIARGTQNNQINFASNSGSGNGATGYEVPIVPIYFSASSTPWVDSNQSGSIIQYAVLNGVPVQISMSSPKIDNCQFNFEAVYLSIISIAGGSPIISNNTIVLNTQGGSPFDVIDVEGPATPLIVNNKFEGDYASVTSNGIEVNSASPTITGNIFEALCGSESDGVSVSSGAPLISNNQFEGNGNLTGVDDSSTASLTISNNVFINCYSGVMAEAASVLTVENNSFLEGYDGVDVNSNATVTITGNLIDSNSQFGINGGGIITSNTITNNRIGIHNPLSGPISYNNIVGNTENSITTSTPNIDAVNNWWGIADARTINQTIYDHKVDPRLGTVSFVPFLTAPSPSAPPIPSTTPTITPIPTPNPTPQPTSPPVTIAPTATPVQYSQTLLYQAGAMISLNLITTSVAIVLVIAWVVVVLGYVTKGGLQKHKDKDRRG